jgi:hypothetical protein
LIFRIMFVKRDWILHEQFRIESLSTFIICSSSTIGFFFVNLNARGTTYSRQFLLLHYRTEASNQSLLIIENNYKSKFLPFLEVNFGLISYPEVAYITVPRLQINRLTYFRVYMQLQQPISYASSCTWLGECDVLGFDLYFLFIKSWDLLIVKLFV